MLTPEAFVLLAEEKKEEQINATVCTRYTAEVSECLVACWHHASWVIDLSEEELLWECETATANASNHFLFLLARN